MPEISDVDSWPMPPGLPQMETGQLIRSRKITEPPMTSRQVRLGGAEPKVIVAETREYVIFRVWSSRGADLGEQCMRRDEFERDYERGGHVAYVP